MHRGSCERTLSLTRTGTPAATERGRAVRLSLESAWALDGSHGVLDATVSLVPSANPKVALLRQKPSAGHSGGVVTNDLPLGSAAGML